MGTLTAENNLKAGCIEKEISVIEEKWFVCTFSHALGGRGKKKTWDKCQTGEVKYSDIVLNQSNWQNIILILKNQNLFKYIFFNQSTVQCFVNQSET